MAIIFSVVARGPTILAKHAVCAGNFLEVAEQVLAKIDPGDGKLTYSHGRFLLHYICESTIIYMCITDDVSLKDCILKVFYYHKIAKQI